MCYNKIMCTAQHSTAQHSTAQHSTALNKPIGLFFQRFKHLFNLLSSKSNSYLNTNSNILTTQFLLKSLVNSIFLISCVNIANAALTATTANTIQGTKPQLVGIGTSNKINSIDDLVSVIEPEFSTKLSQGGITSKTFASSYKLVDIKPYITYLDSDGDAGNSSYTSLSVYGIVGVDGITYEWEDKKGRKITDLNEVFSYCLSPYKLTMKATNAKVASNYGNPYESGDNGTHTGITYEFIAPINIGGCLEYLKPNSMDYNVSTDSTKVSFIGGYDATVFDTTKGFKVDSGFPVTGFKGAQFSLIGSGSDQSGYNCIAIDNNGKITLSSKAGSGSDCTVTYNVGTLSDFEAGGTTPTIEMYYSGNRIDRYTIPAPTKWEFGDGVRRPYGNTWDFNVATKFPGLDYCRTFKGEDSLYNSTTREQATGFSSPNDYRAWRQTYMYRRNEITNAPYATLTAEGAGSRNNYGGYYSRAADGTFMGEWGSLGKYENSPWKAYRITNNFSFLSAAVF